MYSDVLRTFKVNHTDLMGMVAELKNDFSIMRQDVQKIRGWVTETKCRISDLEDTVNHTLLKLSTYGGKMATLENKWMTLRTASARTTCD